MNDRQQRQQSAFMQEALARLDDPEPMEESLPRFHKPNARLQQQLVDEQNKEVATAIFNRNLTDHAKHVTAKALSDTAEITHGLAYHRAAVRATGTEEEAELFDRAAARIAATAMQATIRDHDTQRRVITEKLKNQTRFDAPPPPPALPPLPPPELPRRKGFFSR